MKARRDDTYVDDIQYGSDKVEALTGFKEEATLIMNELGFTLHKWHSNVAPLKVHIKTRDQLERIKGPKYWVPSGTSQQIQSLLILNRATVQQSQ